MLHQSLVQLTLFLYFPSQLIFLLFTPAAIQSYVILQLYIKRFFYIIRCFFSLFISWIHFNLKCTMIHPFPTSQVVIHTKIHSSGPAIPKRPNCFPFWFLVAPLSFFLAGVILSAQSHAYVCGCILKYIWLVWQIPGYRWTRLFLAFMAWMCSSLELIS